MFFLVLKTGKKKTLTPNLQRLHQCCHVNELAQQILAAVKLKQGQKPLALQNVCLGQDA